MALGSGSCARLGRCIAPADRRLAAPTSARACTRRLTWKLEQPSRFGGLLLLRRFPCGASHLAACPSFKGPCPGII